MSIYDFDDLHMAAQSCKHLKPKISAVDGNLQQDGISCTICSSWNGSRCSRRVLDNMLSGPELD